MVTVHVDEQVTLNRMEGVKTNYKVRKTEKKVQLEVEEKEREK